MSFQHRNGETEPPAGEHDAYWFQGDIEEVTRFDVPTLVVVLEHSVLLVGEKGEYFIGWFKGQWWGPVVPPWATSE